MSTFTSPSSSLKVRRQSEQPLLPSLSIDTATNRRLPSRWIKTFVATTAILWVLGVVGGGGGGETLQNFLKSREKVKICEVKGMFTPWKRQDEQRRLTIRVRPHEGPQDVNLNPDNTILSTPFHASLSSQLSNLFDNSSNYLPPSQIDQDQSCLEPSTHSLPLLPRAQVSSESPTIFFSVCTAPERAVTYAPVWKHFMSAPEQPLASTVDNDEEEDFQLPAPGCIVTDAQGVGDSKGMARATKEFRRNGLSCIMKESSRVGERYEMRVLGLVRDAWVESERRRWQEGSELVEWFIFGDDDTWWSDMAMVREMLSAYDSREDHYFGSFSESRGTVETFGRISFGGGGTIVSRGLVRKMQSTLDRCADRFRDVFGGDGIMSNCAAWTRDISLDHLVEEIPSMRQMDMHGDATGYLTSGRTPFMTLHHWASWLSLIPDRNAISSVTLFSRAASILGGPNFLRRFIFDNGLVEVTLGYAVTLYRDPLQDEHLGSAEWSWEAHEPYLPARPKVEEGKQKLTYYITAIDRLSPHLAIFHHTCSHPSLSSTSLKTFSILYDTRSESTTSKSTTTWSPRRLFGNAVGGGKAAQPSPRRDELAQRQRRRTKHFRS